MTTDSNHAERFGQIELFIHQQGAKPVTLQVLPQSSIAEVVNTSEVAGLDTNNIYALLDKTDNDDVDQEQLNAPVDSRKRIDEFSTGRSCHLFFYRCRSVCVSVNYKCDTEHRHFSPHVKLKRILKWAKRKFNLTDCEADNLILRLCEGNDRLRLHQRLGEVIQGECCNVCFDLVHDYRVEG